MAKWNENLSQAFWNKRPFHCIIKHENIDQRIEKKQSENECRKISDTVKKNNFAEKFELYLSQNHSIALPGAIVAQNLKFWIEHMSWTYCNICKELKTECLLPNYFKHLPLKFAKQCTCINKVYVNPSLVDIPNVLKHLTHNEILVLRPFNVHIGQYIKAQNGYRQKSNLFRLTLSQKSVIDKILCMENRESMNRCLQSYQFLMSNENSSYAKFVSLRDNEIGKDHKFNVYDFQKNVGIECALWPNLYPTTQFCETALSGSENRASMKVAFMKKVFSQISDYGTDFELLQFHYDLWLFKTVSGAITTGRKKYCSPARALETKTFSSEFWKWQHRCLTDATRQFGFPTLFITISPSEWSFPMPPWLKKLQQITGLGETELPAFETLHIANTLEQIVRGYLCGSNDKAWKSHLFSYKRKSSMQNVINYFYRFEFQKRGTVHIHILIWLRSIEQISLENIRGDIPWVDIDSAYLVHKLQSSDKGSLTVHNGQTIVEKQNGIPTLKIRHPPEAFAENLRGYISTILPALKCRMDVQSSDGHGLLLKYVSSYVTKAHDAYKSDSLYTSHTSPFEAAFRHVKEMRPLEPKMWLSMSSKKIAWTPHRLKRFAVPLSTTANDNKIVQSYWGRAKHFENLSLLQWLRQYDTSKSRIYKDGKTFVGTKRTSIFRDEYFFEDMLLNVPHRNTAQLLVANFEAIPDVIKYFVCAMHHRANIWASDHEIKSIFELEGNKSWFVANVLLYIQSLKDLHTLWRRRVISFHELKEPLLVEFPLDQKQQLVISLLEAMLSQRHEHYQSVDCGLDYIDSDSDSDDDDSTPETLLSPSLPRSTQNNVDWHKFLLIVGRHGTGKSYTLTKAIQLGLSMDYKVLVATPTGFLSTQYKDKFSNHIDTDTVHAAFHYPVNANEQPNYNWNISNYDIVIVDKVSMIPIKIFEHVLATFREIPIRPVVLLAGDDRQLQPIEEINGKIQTTKTAMAVEELTNITVKVLLTKQHRNNGGDYEKFLEHIRLWQPSQSLLTEVQHGKILHNEDPTDEELLETLKLHTTSTVITVSRHAANRINKVVINNILKKSMFLGYIESDCELGKIPLFKGMRVMITQNRNKDLTVVNGRIAHVIQMEGKTVFLRLGNNNIVQLYPVSFPTEDGIIKTCLPLMPAYALTIPKAEGITVDHCIVWLDSPVVAPGGAYVALSRCKDGNNLKFMVPMSRTQIKPVHL